MCRLTDVELAQFLARYFPEVPPLPCGLRFYAVIDPYTGAMALIDTKGARPKRYLSFDGAELKLAGGFREEIGRWPRLGPDGKPPPNVPILGLSDEA